jgi:hypothetical protein
VAMRLAIMLIITGLNVMSMVIILLMILTLTMMAMMMMMFVRVMIIIIVHAGNLTILGRFSPIRLLC